MTTEEMVPQQKYLLQLLRFAAAYRLFQERLKPTETPEKATARDKAQEFNRIYPLALGGSSSQSASRLPMKPTRKKQKPDGNETSWAQLEIEIAAGAASAGHKPLDLACRTIASLLYW
jgi:hypothetical protein